MNCWSICAAVCKVKCGERTADGRIHRDCFRVFGACDRAPMMLVDEKVVGPGEEIALEIEPASSPEARDHG